MTRNKSLTEMIEEGMSLREMSSELNHQLSHEAIRQYIMDSGNHKEWLNKREETEKTKKSKKKLKDIRRKLKETLTNKLSNSIYQVFKNKSLEKGWSYQKAIEYREKVAFKQTSFDFKDLIKALDKYETAYLKDKKLSLRELSENTNISNSSTMGRILNEISLEPLYGSRNSKNKGYKS